MSNILDTVDKQGSYILEIGECVIFGKNFKPKQVEETGSLNISIEPIIALLNKYKYVFFEESTEDYTGFNNDSELVDILDNLQL